MSALVRNRRTTVTLRARAVEPEVTRDDFGSVDRDPPRLQPALTLYDGMKLGRTFGVATGQSRYPTPLGASRSSSMQGNPWWYPPDSDWAEGLEPVPPGPGNPLGTRWMGIIVAGRGHPRHARPGVARVLGLARLHPHADPRGRVALRARDGRDAGVHRLGLM